MGIKCLVKCVILNPVSLLITIYKFACRFFLVLVDVRELGSVMGKQWSDSGRTYVDLDE